MTQKRYAVLIDCENISAKNADRLFASMFKLGNFTVRRAYGDFSQETLKPWLEKIDEFALIARLHATTEWGKNSADIAIAIDAIELALSGNFDGFCLVSSDRDFTHLAKKLREYGLEVLGYGNKQTSESYKRAFSKFTVIDVSGIEATPAGTPKSDDTAQLRKLLTKAIHDLGGSNGKCINLNELGAHLKEVPISYKEHGLETLGDALRKFDVFELLPVGGPARSVRYKPATTNSG